MKKMTLLAALAALSSLVSCQKEEAVNGNGEMKVIYPEFTASIGTEETKTTVDLSDGKVSWESSDTIIVSDGKKSAVYKIKSIDGTGKATFEVKDDTQPILGAGPYTATYGTEPSTSQTYSATAGGFYMTAPSTSDKSFTFTVACGLMKLSLTKTGESVKSIAVTGTPTGGSQTTYTLTCETAESIDAAKDFCIALPAGEYNKIEIADNTGKICILNASTALSVNNNKIRPVTIGAAKINFNLLGGVFSVSDDKKVRFSKGNLYWKNDESAWHLESHQYDYPSDWDENHIGLLYWTKTAAASYAEEYNDGECADTDKFFCDGSDAEHTLTVDGQSGLYALSKDEWKYLLSAAPSGRGTGASKFKKGVKVAGKANCLIIAPDGYSGTIASEYTAEEWSAAESQGLVCLPAAGGRDGSNVDDVGSIGFYWSSTPDDEGYACSLIFYGSDVYPAGYNYRSNGYSVRLVYSVH